VDVTAEEVGVGAYGAVRRGLLYGHVPVALKVGIPSVVPPRALCTSSLSTLPARPVGPRLAVSCSTSPSQAFHVLVDPVLWGLARGSPAYLQVVRKILGEAR
jgi:hypothetical protein